MRWRHGRKHLKAGQSAKIEVWFFERGGGAGLKVYWSGPGFGKRIISSGHVSTAHGGGKKKKASCKTENVSYSRSRASSRWSNNRIGHSHGKGRLDSNQAWSARHNRRGEWWQMDLGSKKSVGGVVTQGRTAHNQYVTGYKVQVSDNGHHFRWVDGGRVMRANSGANNHKKTNMFRSRVNARYVRIVVWSWRGHISMRSAVITCGGSGGGGKPGFKAQFWHNIHGLHNVHQAKHKVRNRRATISKTVDKIDYRSTGGHWHGLNGHFRDNWVAKFEGYLKIARSGWYTFWTNSDDGSWLLINGHRVVNNDGLHGMRWRHGRKHLKAGQSAKIEVWFFERGGGAGLKVYWSGPGFGKRIISSGHVSTAHGGGKKKKASCKTENVSYSRSRASSRWSNNRIGHSHGKGRLDSNQAWSARHNRRGEWWQMDLGSKKSVGGVVTQGRTAHNQYVTGYKVQVSDNGHHFRWVDGGRVMRANSGANNHKKTNMFRSRVNARYVRIYVWSWRGHISMRSAVITCGGAGTSGGSKKKAGDVQVPVSKKYPLGLKPGRL